MRHTKTWRFLNFPRQKFGQSALKHSQFVWSGGGIFKLNASCKFKQISLKLHLKYTDNPENDALVHSCMYFYVWNGAEAWWAVAEYVLRQTLNCVKKMKGNAICAVEIYRNLYVCLQLHNLLLD